MHKSVVEKRTCGECRCNHRQSNKMIISSVFNYSFFQLFKCSNIFQHLISFITLWWLYNSIATDLPTRAAIYAELIPSEAPRVSRIFCHQGDTWLWFSVRSCPSNNKSMGKIKNIILQITNVFSCICFNRSLHLYLYTGIQYSFLTPKLN